MRTKKALPCLIAGLFAGTPVASMAADPAGAVKLEEVTVTGTREGRLLSETPATIDVVKGEEIREIRPTHPSQVMGRVPGVWVNVTGGEGHVTAIRQPLTTNPVYLYLEDGIPTRSTGFFNHNALYEINVPQAGGIEVSKGPGTALYGSDAIGGVVNVLTRPAPLKPEAEVSVDLGEFGWRRALLSGGTTTGDNGLRADLNVTHTDGWRDNTAYDRQGGTLRWDRALGGDAVLKTVATFSNIDQETAGTSTISESDYQNNPTANYTPISFRKVKAFRLSMAYEKEMADSLLSFTPYFRYNDMDLLANWSLTYDPTVYNTSNKSLGLLAKYRQDFAPWRARIIVGADLDHSPGSRLEQSINTTKSGRVYTSYALGQTIYDYDVTFQGVSPYVHGEASPTERLRLTAGLRYDYLRYDYDNKLSDANIVLRPSNIAFNLTYRHPSDTTVSYNHLSPKLGATFAFTPTLSGYANYNHAFRAPSEGQLFRPGSTVNTIGLMPIKVDSFELGLRGKAREGVNYEASVYHMTKRDDILSSRDPATGATQSVNAGKTLHRGVELGLGAEFARQWRLDVAWSYSKHTYDEFVSTSGNFNGKEMETAPRVVANARLGYRPAVLNGGRMELEWVHLGSYWMDAANTNKYDGHDLLNLRLNYLASKEWEIFGSITNLTDERYAESTAYTTTRGREFAPGLPRTYYAGVRYGWK